MEIRHLLISGQVQGVGYRHSMVRAARNLGVSGWVKNRSDGGVEAMVAGSAEAVAAIIHWARQGPPDADVAQVAVELGVGSYTGFEQRPTD